MSAVTPFGRELVAELGGPRGRIETYTEVPLHTPDGGSVYPDGAIVARRGKTVWSALVEVKTGNSSLDADQVVCSLDAARSEGFDGVLIITTTSSAAPTTFPSRFRKRNCARHSASPRPQVGGAVFPSCHRVNVRSGYER
jgi:hypothetical protein